MQRQRQTQIPYGNDNQKGNGKDNATAADDVNSIIHVINPTTGIMSLLAGGASSVCTAASAAAIGEADAPRGATADLYGNVISRTRRVRGSGWWSR